MFKYAAIKLHVLVGAHNKIHEKLHWGLFDCSTKCYSWACVSLKAVI